MKRSSSFREQRFFSCVYSAGEREFRYPTEDIRDAKAEIKERVASFPLVLAATRAFESSDSLKFDFKNRASSSALPTVPPTFAILFFAKRVVEMCFLDFRGIEHLLIGSVERSTIRVMQIVGVEIHFAANLRKCEESYISIRFNLQVRLFPKLFKNVSNKFFFSLFFFFCFERNTPLVCL